MQPFQEKYIENCKAVRALTVSPVPEADSFQEACAIAARNNGLAREIARENTEIIEEQILPLLDDLFRQDRETLQDLESFADALTKGAQPTDLALACQLHRALLNRARRAGDREWVIRELYKLGMALYSLHSMMAGLELQVVYSNSAQMRYCFVEAGSYLKYFDEFPEETQSYILRSLANTYLGSFRDWHEKLERVRYTRKVFWDERYQAAAPGLPWEAYRRAVHRQMSGALPYTFEEGELSPDEVADVMESAQLVYEHQYEDVRHNGEVVDAHSLLSYYSIEYSCGLLTQEELLTLLENLMDQADLSRYDETSNYLLLSMPPFYAQFLKKMPEKVPSRRQYVIRMYDKMIRYIEAMPLKEVTSQIRLYVRQIISVFVEVPGGPTLLEMVQMLMARFAPELYAHGYAVGRMAQALCDTILDGEPAYFDDIPRVAALSQKEEKRRAVQELAYCSGLLHDIGKISFAPLYDHQSRQMLSSEEKLLHAHANVGWIYLDACDSTKPYADAALGHHRWYDGSDGYPEEYRRKESPSRAIIDVISFADFLEQEEGSDTMLPLRSCSFEERISQALKEAGRRFSPLVTGWLHTPELLERLKDLYETGRWEGYRRCFRKKVPGDDPAADKTVE